MLIKKLIASAIVAAAAFASPAQATVTISFAGGNSPTTGVDGNIRNFSSGGISVQATGWTLNGSTLETSWLGSYANGLGVTNDTERGWNLFNPYGVDNSGGFDFILLVFNQAVNLQGATLTPVQSSWTPADNDVTISHANVAGAFQSGTLPLNSPAWANLGTALSNVNGNNSAPYFTVLNASNYENVWLIAASGSSPDFLADGFQLNSIVVNPSGVPEPSTWAMLLMGFGAVGLSARKRRRRPLTQMA